MNFSLQIESFRLRAEILLSLGLKAEESACVPQLFGATMPHIFFFIFFISFDPTARKFLTNNLKWFA